MLSALAGGVGRRLRATSALHGRRDGRWHYRRQWRGARRLSWRGRRSYRWRGWLRQRGSARTVGIAHAVISSPHRSPVVAHLTVRLAIFHAAAAIFGVAVPPPPPPPAAKDEE